MASESGSHGEFNGDTVDTYDYTIDTSPVYQPDDAIVDNSTVDDDSYTGVDDNPLYSMSFEGHDVGIFDNTTQFDAHQNTNGQTEYSIIFRASSVDDSESGWVFNWNSVDDTMTLSHNDHSIDLGSL